jgi:hypothetical protein
MPKTPIRPYKASHTPIPLYKAANTSHDAVKKLPDENDVLLAKHKAALNTNTILRYLVNRTYQIEADLIQIHAKLQPILKSIGDDSDWRNTIWRNENE